MFKTVILGKADAGATLDVDIAKITQEVKDQLRPVMTTEEINPHPLSAHPRVPEAIRRTVTEAVLRLGADEKTQDLLRTIRMPSPVAADYARDYQGIEVLDINSLIHEQ